MIWNSRRVSASYHFWCSRIFFDRWARRVGWREVARNRDEWIIMQIWKIDGDSISHNILFHNWVDYHSNLYFLRRPLLTASCDVLLNGCIGISEVLKGNYYHIVVWIPSFIAYFLMFSYHVPFTFFSLKWFAIYIFILGSVMSSQVVSAKRVSTIQ